MDGEELTFAPRPEDVGMVAIQEKSRLEAMVSMAKFNPRSITVFQRKVRELCCQDEAVAAQCLYALPRKNRDGSKVKIEGPSIRMAEIILKAWKNAGVFGRVIDDSGDFVVAQAIFIDFEDLTMVSKEVRRRITGSNGHRYSADMIGVTANAAISIACRNAILGAIPRALWNEAFEESKATAAGTLDTLNDRRAAALDFLAKNKVGNDRVFAALDVQGVEDIGLDELATLRALVSAIKQGDMTAEQAFPPVVEPSETKPATGLEGVKAKVAEKVAA
jgi:hypothetical protein